MTNNKEVQDLKNMIVSLLAWTYGGVCNDCYMFRQSPSCITFLHHKDCMHLKTINAAYQLIGGKPVSYHSYDDPIDEMNRLAEKRASDWLARQLKHPPIKNKDKL
jgi:hypothetical protein